LQVALFDAVGKTNGVPVHRLLGRQQRERAFISWWCNDMPKEDWVSEAKDAIALGYTAMKAKARPWFDLHEQLRALTAILPAHFDFDFDFNSMLLDSSRGGPYLASLEQYPNVAIFETPIPQSDVEGNKQLRQATHIPIAMHYGSPPIMTALSQEVCDGFVIGGTSPSRAIQQGNVAAMANKSFWLQMNGTGITATWGTHLAAVLSHARWPAVNVNNLYTESMIRPKFKVENGFAAVPEAPGLGVELDEDAVERYRIEPLKEEPGPPKDMLYAIRFPSGATSYYTDGRKYRRDFEAGLLPVFLRGIHMEPIKDNGSREWREIHAKAQHAGVHLGGRPL
jgi:L-alanine-DL-glutamate epimerase-like enolase superfamily enzyme